MFLSKCPITEYYLYLVGGEANLRSLEIALHVDGKRGTEKLLNKPHECSTKQILKQISGQTKNQKLNRRVVVPVDGGWRRRSVSSSFWRTKSEWDLASFQNESMLHGGYFRSADIADNFFEFASSRNCLQNFEHMYFQSPRNRINAKFRLTLERKVRLSH